MTTTGRKRAIIISARGEDTFTPDQAKQLRAVLDVRFHEQRENMTAAAFGELCRAAAIIGLTRRAIADFDDALVRQLPNLEALAIYSTGYEWLDLAALAERRIVVSYLPDYSMISVAEHTLAMLLTLSRRSHLANDRARSLVPAGTSLRGWEWRGRTAGIFGKGRIGSEIGRLLTALGMTVSWCDPYRPGPGLATCAELLAGSDAVILACPRQRHAPPLLGAAEIALMPARAVLVNPSRRDLVDTAAAVAAIENKRLAGYAVDDDISPFIAGRNIEAGRILQTMHTAWYSDEAIARGTAEWVANLTALGRGQPRNIIGATA